MTTLDLFVLLQTCMDSLSITDGAGVFRYTKEARAKTVDSLIQELRNETRPVAISPDSVRSDVEPLDVPGGDR